MRRDHRLAALALRWCAAGAQGCGLYIAKGIVESHGGKIWAESSAGGARFTFILPLAR